jgi:fimbrial chaperone protein
LFAVLTAPLKFRPFAVAALALVAGLCAPVAALAMRVSPMVSEMSTTGADAVARIELQNLNQTKLPYETHVTLITFDADGHPSESPADQDFLVFPPQGVLVAGGRQVIRVQWVGPQLDSSRAYYVSINQLPVSLDPATAGAAPGAQLQIVYHMKALVVVAPPGATPNVTSVEAKPAPYQAKSLPGETPPAPVPGLAITLKNTGKRHAMMGGLRWIVDGTGLDGKPLQVIFPLDKLNQYIGSGYLGPLGAMRTYSLPTPTPFGPGPIRVRFAQ